MRASRVLQNAAAVSANQLHCRELVRCDNMYCLVPFSSLSRRHDYEGYLCALFMPAQLREDILAVRAFNVELAIVRCELDFKQNLYLSRSDAVKEDHIGLMRFEFWRRALHEVCPAGHSP